MFYMRECFCCSESRYLLILTENYGALTIIKQLFQTHQEKIRLILIFGSSFRSDQEYTQVSYLCLECILCYNGVHIIVFL